MCRHKTSCRSRRATANKRAPSAGRLFATRTVSRCMLMANLHRVTRARSKDFSSATQHSGENRFVSQLNSFVSKGKCAVNAISANTRRAVHDRVAMRAHLQRADSPSRIKRATRKEKENARAGPRIDAQFRCSRDSDSRADAVRERKANTRR